MNMKNSNPKLRTLALKTFITSLLLMTSNPFAAAEESKTCHYKRCIGDLVTSYEIEGAKEGRIVGFTMEPLQGWSQDKKHLHAVVDLGSRKQSVYIARLNDITPGECIVSKSKGMQMRACTGDRVYLKNQWLTLVSIKPGLLYRTDTGKVINADYSNEITVRRFDNCEKFLSQDVCQTFEYKNALGQTETLLGVKLQQNGRVAVQSPLQAYPINIDLRDLQDRVEGKTSYVRKLKFKVMIDSRHNAKSEIESRVLTYAKRHCKESFLRYGQLNKSETKVEVGSCKSDVTFPGFGFGFGHAAPAKSSGSVDWECSATLTLACEDGSVQGLPSTDIISILNMPDGNVFPSSEE